jgi:O-antigen/teichoic acid export membrane protein
MKTIGFFKDRFSSILKTEHLFLLSMLVVNGGNYLYNLLLGRILGPKAFADAALLITFLLLLSFVGMTFQIVTTKYCVLFNSLKKEHFIRFISKSALIFGSIIGALFFIFSKSLQTILNTQSNMMFKIIGVGIPLYFLMSVNRGIYQGEKNIFKMSVTYQTEMISRLLFTLLVVLFVPNLPTPIAVASGITLSFIFGLFPFKKTILKLPTPSKRTVLSTKNIVAFFALTAFYELTQIIINNSDVILVKHYFSNESAGLYASLALIGRVVYFVTWIFVMMLLPKAIELHKEGKNTTPLLLKNVLQLCVFSIVMVLITYFFPQTVVQIMFGKQFLVIAPLLWKYALATALFALSNVFAYYYLSIGNYIPVILAAILGCVQLLLIVLFHQSLSQVVEMQQIAMAFLLFLQLVFFFSQYKKSIRLS